MCVCVCLHCSCSIMQVFGSAEPCCLQMATQSKQQEIMSELKEDVQALRVVFRDLAHQQEGSNRMLREIKTLQEDVREIRQELCEIKKAFTRVQDIADQPNVPQRLEQNINVLQEEMQQIQQRLSEKSSSFASQDWMGIDGWRNQRWHGQASDGGLGNSKSGPGGQSYGFGDRWACGACGGRVGWSSKRCALCGDWTCFDCAFWCTICKGAVYCDPCNTFSSVIKPYRNHYRCDSCTP